jgi:hypothetical protein
VTIRSTVVANCDALAVHIWIVFKAAAVSGSLTVDVFVLLHGYICLSVYRRPQLSALIHVCDLSAVTCLAQQGGHIGHLKETVRRKGGVVTGLLNSTLQVFPLPITAEQGCCLNAGQVSDAGGPLHFLNIVGSLKRPQNRTMLETQELCSGAQ